MQSCLLLMLFLAQALTSSAKVEISVEDFTIASGETKEVAVLLTNDQPVTALQLTVDLPKGLTYKENSVNKTARVKGRGAMVQASDKDAYERTGKLVIVETDGTIAAGEGAIITFSVEAGTLDDKEEVLNIEDIEIVDDNGTKLNENKTCTAKVKMLGLDCKFSAPESIEVSVGQEYQVDVTMTNVHVQDLTALQGTLTLPEGLEIVLPDEEESEERFIYSDRIPKQSQFKFEDNNGSINFVLSSSMNAKIIENDGVIFSFIVKATADLAEEAEISLTDLRVATTTGKSQLCDPLTIKVTNTSVADRAAFDEYKAEQAAALEALAEEGDSEASQAIIADAVADIEALEYDEEKSLDENKAAIDEVAASAQEALAAQRAAEQLAADKEAFAEYLAEQAAAVEALAEEDDSEAAQQILADAKAAIEALEYDEEKSLDENKAAVDAVAANAQEALTAQRAADAEAAKAAANEEAYTTLKAQYDELRAALRQAKNTIKNDYPEVASQFDDTIADLEDMLSDAIAKLEGAYAAEKLTAESTLQNGEAIAAGIEALLADVAAAQLAADKAAFEAYVAEQAAAVEAMAEEGDSEASQAIIADAVEAINALEYDEEKTLDENKAAVDELVAPVADALEAQREADAIIPGDVNGDGKINTVDASYILMYLVGNTPEDFVEKAADVDGDGKINTLDATAILKKLVE